MNIWAHKKWIKRNKIELEKEEKFSILRKYYFSMRDIIKIG